jgi:hypothetical protein
MTFDVTARAAGALMRDCWLAERYRSGQKGQLMNEQPQQNSGRHGPAILPNCPYCGVPLRYERTEGDTQYYACERCGGLVMPPMGPIRHLETLRNKKNPRIVFDAVTAWQHDPDVFPLTCARNRRHRLLVPIREADRVVLQCRDCGYRQAYVPDAIVKAYGEKKRRPSRKRESPRP